MIAYKDGYRFVLAEEYSANTGIRPARPIVTDFIKLYSSGMLILAKGYAWNGASGPAVNTKSTIRASAEHDAFYQLIRLGLLHYDFKRLADARLRHCMLEDGANPVRAWYFQQAVKYFGYSSAVPSGEPPVLRAP